MLEELTPRKAVEFAIKTERLGQMFYRKAAKKLAADAQLKKVFELLAEDEALHERQFRGLLDAAPIAAEKPGSSAAFQLMRAMSISAFFTGEEGVYRDIESIEGRDAALMRAFGLEKATLQYYNAMQEALGRSDVLDAIIEAEKSHVLKLMTYLLTDAKFRGIADDF